MVTSWCKGNIAVHTCFTDVHWNVASVVKLLVLLEIDLLFVRPSTECFSGLFILEQCSTFNFSSVDQKLYVIREVRSLPPHCTGLSNSDIAYQFVFDIRADTWFFVLQVLKSL